MKKEKCICGALPRVVIIKGKVKYQCCCCGISGPAFSSPEKAKQAWNTLMLCLRSQKTFYEMIVPLSKTLMQ